MKIVPQRNEKKSGKEHLNSSQNKLMERGKKGQKLENNREFGKTQEELKMEKYMERNHKK